MLLKEFSRPIFLGLSAEYDAAGHSLLLETLCKPGSASFNDLIKSNSEIQLLTSASRGVLIRRSAMPSSPDNTISRHSSGRCLLNVTPYHVLNGKDHLEGRRQEGIISHLERAQHTKNSDLSSAREKDLLPQEYQHQEGGFLPLRNTTPWKSSLSGDFNWQPSCTRFSLDTQSTRCVFKEQLSNREGKLF